MEKWIPIASFPDLGSANEFIALLNSENIEFEIENHTQGFKLDGGDPINDQVVISIREIDINKFDESDNLEPFIEQEFPAVEEESTKGINYEESRNYVFPGKKNYWLSFYKYLNVPTQGVQKVTFPLPIDKRMMNTFLALNILFGFVILYIWYKAIDFDKEQILLLSLLSAISILGIISFLRFIKNKPLRIFTINEDGIVNKKGLIKWRDIKNVYIRKEQASISTYVLVIEMFKGIFIYIGLTDFKVNMDDLLETISYFYYVKFSEFNKLDVTG